MSGYEDDGVYDGPNIRPPPSASAARERDRRQVKTETGAKFK